MIKCVIVDDEPIARRGMKRMVEQHPELDLLACVGSAEETLSFLAENDVDLLFLDIRMPGLSGLELARRLPQRTMVIFTTAYPDFALESYSVDAIGYLVKPINRALFDKAVGKALEYSRLLAAAADEPSDTRPSQEYIIVKADRRYHRIAYRDILYVEGLKDYVIMHLADGRRLITRITVKGMEDSLPGDVFLRVNKSYIVNLSAVASFDSKDIFIGDMEISIGMNYRDAVMERLMS